MRREADDALPVEPDVAGVRAVDTGDEVEERRLAGTVRADDAHDLPVADFDVEVEDALQPAESLAYVLELQERRPSHDLHAWSPEQALRSGDHDDDEDHPEQQ